MYCGVTVLMGGAGGSGPPGDCWWQRPKEERAWEGQLPHGTPPGCCVFFVGDSEASFTLSWSCLGTDVHLQASCKGKLQ